MNKGGNRNLWLICFYYNPVKLNYKPVKTWIREPVWLNHFQHLVKLCRPQAYKGLKCAWNANKKESGKRPLRNPSHLRPLLWRHWPHADIQVERSAFTIGRDERVLEVAPVIGWEFPVFDFDWLDESHGAGRHVRLRSWNRYASTPAHCAAASVTGSLRVDSDWSLVSNSATSFGNRPAGKLTSAVKWAELPFIVSSLFVYCLLFGRLTGSLSRAASTSRWLMKVVSEPSGVSLAPMKNCPKPNNSSRLCVFNSF